MCKKFFRTKTIRGKTFIYKYDHYVLWIYDYTIFCAIFFIHLKPRSESFWGVLSCCLTLSILFNYSAIDVIINFLWKIFYKRIILVVLTTAIIWGGISNFWRYCTRSQTGKSIGYRPTLKPLQGGSIYNIKLLSQNI
jgi:hypothetical protein